jgi:predicted acetyltransferase
VDFAVQEFFVLNQYRGTGVAARAARDVFDRFRGRWQLHVLPRNTRAIAFWRRTIGAYAGGRFEERADEAPCGASHVFRFDNSHR